MRRFCCLLLLGFVFVLGSCQKITSDDTPDKYRSEQEYRTEDVSELEHIGALNAVKKAYQLTDIEFTPLNPIEYNIGRYEPNVSYTGMIYSSVKEIGTYVGTNVSFHTFMTAIHNPRSLVYTERINHKPYNGTNCKAYYGTVCSGLVSYALGLSPGFGSYDFIVSDDMIEIDYSDPDNIHLADILWRDGHVAMITDVIRNKHGKVISLELSEAAQHGCRRRSMNSAGFKSIMESPYEKVLRYTKIENNLNYTAVPEFVPVLDEKQVPFEYNNSICANKGDKANYLIGEDVILNVFSSFETITIYRDDQEYSIVKGTDIFSDIVLSALPYGNYSADIITESGESERTSWIVVDYDVFFDSSKNDIVFKSNNAEPVQVGFCKLSGGRSYPLSELFCRTLTNKDISIGRINVPKDLMKDDCPYFKVSFKTKYGVISTRPNKIN